MYASASRDPRQQPAYFDDGAAMDPLDEDDYDDPPRPRRRGGLLTAVTLIGCAMIGTAGAYGYRTYYVGPSADRAPPVISAETSPNKVVASAEGQTGKFIQDRLGSLPQNERVVSREEQPVDIATSSSNPRVIYPSTGAPSGFPPRSPLGADGSSSEPASGGADGSARPSTKRTGEARPVRTLRIRPEGSDAPEPAALPAPSRSVAPARKSRGPISLDSQEGTTPPAPRERVATAPSTTQSLPPAPRLSSVQAEAPAGGSYAVQLSSQRSEAEAQASFRSLQGKFPDQLGDRSPMVRRVDLGPKGIYYRALVGPFASSDEAGQFCSGLKAAGGQCFIQRN